MVARRALQNRHEVASVEEAAPHIGQFKVCACMSWINRGKWAKGEMEKTMSRIVATVGGRKKRYGAGCAE